LAVANTPTGSVSRGFAIAKSTVQKILVTHGLGRRSQRLGRAAAITAATTGLLTEAARGDEPFGFCLATGGPGELVCIDSFYVGKLKGVGKVYQLTAIDVFTRWAVVAIVLGPVKHTHTMRFIDQVLRTYRRHGVRVRAILSDNGPEYVASDFRAHLVAKALRHERIPARSPTTTPSASASTAPFSKSAGDRLSIAVTSPRSASSKAKPTRG
jgi:transposase InsO family protein